MVIEDASPRPDAPGHIADAVAIVRLPSVVAGAVEVFLGCFLATGNAAAGGLSIFLAATSMALCVAAAMAFNDVADSDLDRLTKPNRPIPSGRRTTRWAVAVAACAAVCALVCAIPLGLPFCLVCALVLGVSGCYSLAVKNTPILGNATVAACASTPVLVGGRVAAHDVPGRAWAAAGLIFLFMFCYEVLKTISDFAGDQAGGIRTISTTFGPNVSSVILLIAVVVLTIGVAGAGQLSGHLFAYSVLGAIFCASSLTAVVPLLRQGAWRRRESVDRSIFVMRGAWMLGLLTLWLLR